MFDVPTEVRTAAGYLLVLCVGVVFYMRFTFARSSNDVANRSSIARIAVCFAWGVAIATIVWWPDLLRHWNFFMIPQVRWFTTVPAAVGILLIIWAMRSQLAVDDNGSIIASGPYAWCRYPFDAALVVYFISLTLLCSNWMLLAITLSTLLLHRIGVPFELERVRRRHLGDSYDEYAARTGWFLPNATPVKKTQYQVPSRFGLTAILGLLTVLAVIFGALRAVEAPAVIYLFVGSEIVAICLAQILVGSAPRGGSMLIGAILLPLWVYLTLEMPPVSRLIYLTIDGSRDLSPTLIHLLVAVAKLLWFVTLGAFGGLMGYCIGTLAAGFFLMMDVIEPWLIRDRAIYQLPAQEYPLSDGSADSD
ncbi:MAG: hypothetical protein H8E66_24620 [Planctomycetes bacterium]|nr:hypothetical protein [Planctomycetota bacterium]